MYRSAKPAGRTQESETVRDLKRFEEDVTQGLRGIITAVEGREAQIGKLQAEAQERETANADLQRSVDALQRRTAEAENKASHLEQQLGEAVTENRQLADQTVQLKAKDADQRKAADDLRKHLAALEIENEENKRQARQFEEEAAQLTDRCANAEAKAEDMKQHAMAAVMGDIGGGGGGDEVFGQSLLDHRKSTSGLMTPSMPRGTVGSFDVLDGDIEAPIGRAHASGVNASVSASIPGGQHVTPLTPNVFVNTQDSAGITFAPGQGLTCTPEYLHQSVLAYNSRLADLRQAVETAKNSYDPEDFARLTRALRAFNNESRRTMLAMSCIPPGSDLDLYDTLQKRAHELQDDTNDVARSVATTATATGDAVEGCRRQALGAVDRCQSTANDVLNIARRFLPKGREFDPDDMNSMVDKGIQDMRDAVNNAISQLEKIHDDAKRHSKGKDTWKLEVDDRILDACKQLARAIKEITESATDLQHEIENAEGGIPKREFYKRNARWAEGLISSAKEITNASIDFVKAADNAITKGRLEELIVYTEEVSAATIRLAVAGRVKAPKNSQAIGSVMVGTKNVNLATATVVLQVRQSLEMLKQRDAKKREDDEDYVSTLDFYQTNRLEMESKIKAKRLEAELEQEQTWLRTLRKRHAQLVGPEEARRMAFEDSSLAHSRRPGSGMVSSTGAFANQLLSAGPNENTVFFPGDDQQLHHSHHNHQHGDMNRSVPPYQSGFL